MALNKNSHDITEINQPNLQNYYVKNMTPDQNKRNNQKKRKFEIQILAKLSVERKTDNYNKLKLWDQQRAILLTTHRKVVSQILNELEKKLKYSNEYLNIILQFFIQKGEQFKKYTTSNVINPKLFTDSNMLSSNLYKNTNHTLNACYDFCLQYQKNIKDSVESTIRNLIKQIQHNLSETQLEVTIVKQKINSVIMKLQQQNQQTTQKCSQLANDYHKQKNQQAFKCEIDFYTQQEGFMQKAQKQTKAQAELGLQIMKFVDIMIQIELNRGKLIKQSLITFFNLMQLIKHSKIPQVLSQQLKKDEQNKLIIQYYSPEELIGHKLQKEIKTQLKIMQGDPLSLQQLKMYLAELQFLPFQNRNLILKESKAFYKTQEGNFIQTTIIITIDGFLHLYTSREANKSYEQQSDFQFKLDQSIKIEHQSEIELKISCYQNNSFLSYFTSKRINQGNFTFTIYFINEDQKQEFCEFIEKIIY